MINLYIDMTNRAAVNSPTDSTLAVRPDLTTPIPYPFTIFFLRSTGVPNSYNYVRFQNAVITLNLRSKTPVEIAKFSLTFRGAETTILDTTMSAAQVIAALQALPTVGIGNVLVTISGRDMTVQFIGALASVAQPALTVRIISSTPANAQASIEITTDIHNNPIQIVHLKRAPLASTTAWTEYGVPSTPGWQGTLDCSAVSIAEWNKPIGNLALEVTTAPTSARAGADGVTLADGVGRSSADGQVVMSAAITDVAHPSDNGNSSFMIGADVNGIYGRRFRQSDIGCGVTDVAGYILPGTTIVEVIDDGVTNAARLSQRFTQFGVALGTSINYTLAAQPSPVFYSATANFTNNDLGHVLNSPNVPANTRITAIISSSYVRLSQAATATGSGLSWTIVGDMQDIFQSASANFQTADVGSRISAPTVFNGYATIVKWLSTTQVIVDQRPNAAAATGITWTLLPARAYPAPAVTRLTTGNSGTQEVQKIALTNAPTAGQITIQDGFGGSMPVVTLNAPVLTTDIQRLLSAAYANYGQVVVTEVVTGAEWNITFGFNGNQNLLLINDSLAIYTNTPLDWTLMDGVGVPNLLASGTRVEFPNASPPVLTRNSMSYIGFNTQNDSFAVGQPRFGRETDGSAAVNVRVKFMCLADQFAAFPLGTSLGTFNRQFGTFYLAALEGHEERNGLLMVDFFGTVIPSSRVEYHQQQRAVIQPRRTRQNGFLTDIQLTSVSISTWMNVVFTYWLDGGAVPFIVPDGPAGSVVHYTSVDGRQNYAVLYTYNGFDSINGTWNHQYWQSWSRRWWRGAIWEQRANAN